MGRLCVCPCECASLPVSMSEAVSMSVCANVSVLCVIGGVKEGLKEKPTAKIAEEGGEGCERFVQGKGKDLWGSTGVCL